MKDNEAIENTLQNKIINGVIYKATNTVNGKVYIGMTTRGLDVRMTEHRNSISYLKSYFPNALRKYGWEPFVWETIDESTSLEELCDKEVYWIEHYESFGKKGYNMTKGGEGPSGYKMTEENKRAQSERMIEAHANGLYIDAHLRGSDASNSTLLEEEVMEIRDLLIEGQLTIKEIGDLFGVTDSTVYSIRRGDNWKHVVTEEDREKMPVSKVVHLTESEAVEIKELLLTGELTYKEILAATNVQTSANTVSNIKNGRTHSYLMTEEELKKMSEGSWSRLTEKEVIEIKNFLIEGTLSQVVIAEKFNVTGAVISRIKSGKNWKHLFTEEEIRLMNAERKRNKVLIEEDAVKIVSLLMDGVLTLEEIGEKFDISESVISNICRGVSWKDIISDKDLKIIKRVRGIKDKYIDTYEKITEEMVKEIKILLLEGQLMQKEIAKMFNIRENNVSYIKNGKEWSHLFTGEELDILSDNRKKNKNLTKEEVVEIVQLLKESGSSNKAIGEIYDVSSTTIHYIANGDTWKDIVSIGDIRAIKENRERINGKPVVRTERSKVTGEIFNEIEQLLLEGNLNQYEIADKFNITQSVVSCIKNGKRIKIYEQNPPIE